MNQPSGPLKSRFSTFAELLEFFWTQKEWWLFPILVAIFLLGFLVAFAHSSALSPLMYSLF